MGGLLSSEPPPPRPPIRTYYQPPPSPPPQRRNYVPSYGVSSPSFNTEDYNILRDSFRSLNLRETNSIPGREISRPTLIVPNVNSFSGLQTNDQFANQKPPVYTELQPYNAEFQQIQRMITNRRRFKIEKIHKVHNFLLESAYELKKLHKYSLGEIPEEMWLFHGTKLSNLDEICRNNFNWRLHGTNVGHRFGHGVSFSPNAMYASNYPNKNTNPGIKVMIVAKVLVSDICVGDASMTLPPDGFDATMNPPGTVIVKYHDDEFFPAFVIYYHVEPAPNTNYRGKNRAGNLNRQFSGNNSTYNYTLDDI